MINNKEVVITAHAILRAREREIAYPDHVYTVLLTGKQTRFGKHGIKITGTTKLGTIICVGEETNQYIIIKTIERGH